MEGLRQTGETERRSAWGRACTAGPWGWIKYYPPKFHLEPQNGILLGNNLCRCNYLRMERDEFILCYGGPQIQWEWPYERLKRPHRETQGRDHIKVEAENGMMGPQAKECQGHHKLKEAKKDLPLEPSGGTGSCWHLDFRLLALQNCERINYYCLKPPSLW